jgi:hypothetical protein
MCHQDTDIETTKLNNMLQPTDLQPKAVRTLPKYEEERNDYKVPRWAEDNTAILLVHGIGHQLPVETLDLFSRGLIECYQNLFPGKISFHHKVHTIDEDGSIAFQNVLQIRHEDHPHQRIDIYEYYWAYCTQDKANLTDINAWLKGVADGAKKHYKYRNEALGQKFNDESIFFKDGKFISWKYDLFLNVVVKTFIFLNFLIQGTLKLIGFIPFIGAIAQQLLKAHFDNNIYKLSNLVGDIVIYNVTDEKSKFYPVRKKILDGATQLLQSILEQREQDQLKYPSVYVAGHSLGSEISYDAINRINLLCNTGNLKYYNQEGLLQQPMCAEGQEQKLQDQLKGFITFGSPLDKIAFFLRQVVSEEEYIWQQIVNHYHCFKQGEWTDQLPVQKTLSSSSIQRLLDGIPWFNYYDGDDIISGRLDYFVNLTNVECKFNCNPQFSMKRSKFTHSHYWMCKSFYEDIVRNFLSAGGGDQLPVNTLLVGQSSNLESKVITVSEEDSAVIVESMIIKKSHSSATINPHISSNRRMSRDYSLKEDSGMTFINPDERNVNEKVNASSTGDPPNDFENPESFNAGSPPDNQEDSDAPKEPFYLNATHSKETSVNQFTSVIVYLSKEQQSEANLYFAASKSENVDVLIQIIYGFQIIGSEQCVLAVNKAELEKFEFKLKATEKGEGKIRLLAFLNGRKLGFLDLAVKIFEEQKALPFKRIKTEKRPMHVMKSEMPDLVLIIMEQKHSDGDTSISFRLIASDYRHNIYLKPYGSTKIKGNLCKYFNGLFGDIENMNNELTQSKDIVKLKLEKIGTSLYEKLFPEELKRLLWGLKDKIKTLKIDSDEPWIPWEICRMTMQEDGEYKEAGFLCELFEITRWIPSLNAAPPVFNFNKLAIVVPEDSGLEYAKHEKEGLIQLLKDIYSIESIPANYQDLISNFEKGEYSLWHFTGHGSYQDIANPDKSAIILNNDQPFTAENITGKVKNLGKAKPLVFLNACQLGKSGMGLTGIGGWAPQFLSSGVGAFIGAYWQVLDDSAYEFAMTFYKLLFEDNLTIGQAGLEARRKIKEKGDPTWLAYTIYADPYATVDKHS